MYLTSVYIDGLRENVVEVLAEPLLNSGENLTQRPYTLSYLRGHFIVCISELNFLEH